MPKTHLSTELEVTRDCPVLKVQGVLDATNTPGFKHDVAELVAAGYKNLVLDFSKVEFMDSSGIGSLIFVYRSLKEQGGHELWLAGCNDHVKNLLSVTQLDKQFRCFESLPQALDAWKLAGPHG